MADKKYKTDAISIIPEPLKWHRGDGNFEINAETQFVAHESLVDVARLFVDSISPALGFELKISTDSGDKPNSVRLQLDPSLSHLGDEGYKLLVRESDVYIASAAPAGIFYGLQSLRQLLPETIFCAGGVADSQWRIPVVEIEDSPRFTWRGTLLDVGRHFTPKSFILRFIDLLALHKINNFHWHLTDDQGWRIEIKKYPRLTEIGAWRKETQIGKIEENSGHLKYDGIPHGGFYTQDEIRAVVEYARKRFITIVPEIEMPGHAQAAIAAYPELGNTDQRLEVRTHWGINRHICNVEESTIHFFQDVLGEVLELFPGNFIHVGGDEVPTDEWRESPEAQKRMKELRLSDESQLQGYFLRRMEEYLNRHGRRLVGWDEIVDDDLSSSAAIMSWRCNGSDAGAANAGRDVIVASYSHLYLDYYQLEDIRAQPLAIGDYTPLSKTYKFEPVSKDITPDNQKHILGVQAQLWTEFIPSPEQLEYMAFPRLCAASEIAWTASERKNYPGFLNRLVTHLRRLENLHVNFCKRHE